MTFLLKQLVCAIPVLAFAEAAQAGQDDVNISCPGGAASGGYYDPCDEVPGWIEFSLLSSGTIPADGVLVLQGAWRGAQPPGPDTVALTVTVDDAPVAGAVEATQFPGLVIWRPAAAWTAGATATIGGGATNEGADGECLQASLPVSGEVMIAADPGEGLVPVDISGVEMVTLVPTISLETLACCPGEAPQEQSSGCDEDGAVSFDPMKCAPFAGTGIMQLTLTGTSAAVGAVDQQVVYEFVVGGQKVGFSFAPMLGLDGLQAPLCAAIHAVDLGTGATVEGMEECFGEDVAEQLGPQVLDPLATLSCDPQVCEVLWPSWDLEKCTPYGGGGGGETLTGGPTEGGGEGGSEGGSDSSGTTSGQDDDKGCGCDGTGGGGPLVLAALALLGRRRRR